MNTLAALLAPLAVLVSALAPLPARDGAAGDAARVVPDPNDTEAKRAGAASPGFDLLKNSHQGVEQHQVSIEQRVIIRIAPILGDPRQRMPARSAAPDPDGDNVREEKLKGCVPVAAIAAITPGEDNRLLLLLRDRQVLSATLEKSCNAAEFYSGAYVERNADGKLCPKRERLQSRMGSKCTITHLARLVARD